VERAADAEPIVGVEGEQLVFVERRLLPRILSAGAVQHPQRIGRRFAVAPGEDAQVEAHLGRAPLAFIEPLRDAVGLPAGQQSIPLIVVRRHVRRVRVVGLNQRADALAAKVDGRPGPQRVRDPHLFVIFGIPEHELAGELIRHGDLGWRR